MSKEYFVGQDAFLQDYLKASKNPITLDQLAEKVISYLDQNDADQYELSAGETKNGKSVSFPFQRTLYTDENDDTVFTKYTYTGEPYELETDR